VLKKTKVTQNTNPNLSETEVAIKAEVRLVIDYRYLNSSTQSLPFLVLDQQTVLDAIAG